MPRLRSMKEWLWRLGEIRNNLHVLLPSDDVRCWLAVSEDTNRPSERRDWQGPPGSLYWGGSQGLAGLRFTADGDLRFSSRRAYARIDEMLVCPERKGLTQRHFLNLGCIIADLWESCPRTILRWVPWAMHPTGKDGILFYAYFYNMHPLLTARDDFIEDEEDHIWARVSKILPGLMLPCWVFQFDYDWRSVIGFTLDAIRHRVGQGGAPRSHAPIPLKQRRLDVDGEWSKPMSKAKMMAALRIDSIKTFETFAKNQGIQQAGNRQTWRLRVSGLSDDEKARLRDK